MAISYRKAAPTLALSVRVSANILLATEARRSHCNPSYQGTEKVSPLTERCCGLTQREFDALTLPTSLSLRAREEQRKIRLFKPLSRWERGWGEGHFASVELTLTQQNSRHFWVSLCCSQSSRVQIVPRCQHNSMRKAIQNSKVLKALHRKQFIISNKVFNR